MGDEPEKDDKESWAEELNEATSVRAGMKVLMEKHTAIYYSMWVRASTAHTMQNVLKFCIENSGQAVYNALNANTQAVHYNVLSIECTSARSDFGIQYTVSCESCKHAMRIETAPPLPLPSPHYPRISALGLHSPSSSEPSPSPSSPSSSSCSCSSSPLELRLSRHSQRPSPGRAYRRASYCTHRRFPPGTGGASRTCSCSSRTRSR